MTAFLTGCRPVRWLLLAVLLAGAGRAETLTVATYNVENYGPADRLTDEGYRQEYPKPEAEKAALRRVIRELDADVLVLQEIGPAPYFEELRRDLRTEGVAYEFGFLLMAADADRHVAVLSRRPFKRLGLSSPLTFSYLDRTEPVKRGLLAVTVPTDGGELTIFGVHLKSRYTDRVDDPQSAARRLGEATAIRDAVLERFPDPASSRFLLLGDCNDGRTSKPLQRLTHRGKTELLRLLPASDSRGETWTHAYRKEDVYSRVDHILASPGLLSWAGNVSARIHDSPSVAQASDHRPVIVRLEITRDRTAKDE